MKAQAVLLLAICLFSAASFPKPAHLVHNKRYALLVVGHQEDGTAKAMSEMDSIAKLFEKNGIGVFTFYDATATWEKIVKAAPKCHFFVYSGHGTRLGSDGSPGGLCITSRISSSYIQENLRLKENALVLFKSVCMGAGSSAGDTADIGLTEAKNRVAHYAQPFMAIGAAGYYANNYSGGVHGFIVDFLGGMTMGDAFAQSVYASLSIELDEPYEFDKAKRICLSSSPGGNKYVLTTYANGKKTTKEGISPKGYDIAYVGNPNFSVSDME
ncbi:MAG: hypothetical protein HYZ16_11840 [Bacteroidetes bacterium]|jgi:hypothetical protein|nr:hypothetical protein [Bacteroidota bacterium]